MNSLTIYLGWINVFLLAITLSNFFLAKLNKYFVKNKSILVLKLIKVSHKIHRVSGLLFIIFAIIHGYLALQGFIFFHSGYVLFVAILFAAFFGILFAIKKNKTFLNIHKILAFFVLLLLVWHIISVN
jgi:hypothetical protein